MLAHLGPNFPTYITSGTHTKPDIILCNKHIYHNHYSELGPVTASDHLPIIFTITASAIKIPVPERFNTKATDWDIFQNEIRNNLQTLELSENSTAAEIDTTLSNWYNIVIKAMDLHIPLTKHTRKAKPIYNHTIVKIQNYLRNLMEEARVRGWTNNKYRVYKILKQTLTGECKVQHTMNWENTLNTLTEKYRTPEKFWKEIKRLRGSNEYISPYILDNNKKIYKEEEKEPIFRNIWENVFYISPQENQSFDHNNEIRVTNFLTEHQEIYAYSNTSSLARLQNTNYIKRPITTQEIYNIIKEQKNNTPGLSKINKTIMMNLPDEAITLFKDILNH